MSSHIRRGIPDIKLGAVDSVLSTVEGGRLGQAENGMLGNGVRERVCCELHPGSKEQWGCV